MKLVYQYCAIFLNFPPTSNHFYPLQVVNCGSNLRLVVDEDDNGKFRLKRVKGQKVLRLGFTVSLRHLQYRCASPVTIYIHTSPSNSVVVWITPARLTLMDPLAAAGNWPNSGLMSGQRQ